MKKLITIAVITVFSGVPSYGGEPPSYGPINVETKSAKMIDYEMHRGNLGYQIQSDSEIDLLKEQIISIEKLRQSIMGSRTKSQVKKIDDGGLYFLNPQFIYDVTKQSDLGKKIPSIVRTIMSEENYLRTAPLNEARETIDERSQYAAIISKAVSLHVFQEIENRFEQIADMLLTLDQMRDLKGLGEMKMRMKGLLAMIQNEATKLQMVIHSHNIEKTLIHRLQRKRNVQILGSINRGMPTIR
ncbi:hypothetical protein ME7_00966 [Bartonella birtlesii LL-WM9]|uniref:Uncharacterized protein n=1 Tax=Bartonella birtlesii LL-WM9 TaxID=1094552 RepID=J1IXP2_9HYPH|nr:type IV secretion system protein [Bartonella birtlesii]EJF76418.1 hypothetical protein ME7_00962 [Bartonella birtlesii LL-WM9]EJF76422.1 hypothetical protein ME7_00966 [Bartonella birtlesii LL-WM9]